MSRLKLEVIFDLDYGELPVGERTAMAFVCNHSG